MPPNPDPADERLDQTFGALVVESWAWHEAVSYAAAVDEMLVGAFITCALDLDYALIDLTSDGTHHYVRFQHSADASQLLCRLTHLTGDLLSASVHGHRARVVVGYGERRSDVSRIWSALKAEVGSGFLQGAEPGTVTVDGDVKSGYVTVQVDLYLKLDAYIGANYEVHYEPLRLHLDAIRHALRKYLRGRFGQEGSP